MANYNVGNVEIGVVTNSASALKDLNSIIDILNKIKNDTITASKTSSQVAKNLNKVAQRIKSVGNATDKANKKLGTMPRELDKAKNSTEKLSRSLKGVINIGKIYFLFNYLKRFGQGVIRLVGYASTYTETLNKFQVSFKELYKENLQYVDDMARAYGFSRNTLMDYQSTFNNMLKSLKGLSNETSATISQTLTRMAIDYSSLFNVSIQRSMRAFQSVLSGSIRPIREASGFDVSETSIFQVYRELGGQKTMRQLNQLEKRLLRIIAIQQQMQKVGAFGDYEKTIETLANQVRIFQEQIKEFGAIWGRIILVRFKPIVQFLNGVILALNEIGTLLARNIELGDGIDFDKEFEGLTDSANKTDEAIQELNNSLVQLGLDQLNVIGGQSSNPLANMGVSQEILDAVKKYKSALTDVNFKAKEISREILNWLGYTYTENGELEKTGYKLDLIKSILITTVGGAVLGKGVKLVSKIAELLGAKAIGGSVELLGAKIAVIVGFATALVSAFTKIYNTNEEFKTTVDGIKATIKDTFDRINQWFAVDGKPIKEALDWVGNFVTEYLATGLLTGVLRPLEMISKLLTGDLKGAVNVISESFNDIVRMLGRVFNFDGQKFIDDMKKSFEDFPKWFNDHIWKPIANFFIDMINIGIIGAFEKAVNFMVKFVNDFTKGLSSLWTWIGIPPIGQITPVKWGRIPRLATGNVATQPTLAMFGEYSNAKNDPEITSPQSIMQDTFMQSMIPLVNAILKGDQNVVKAINGQNLTLNVNGTKLAEATLDDYERVALRKGKIIFNS